MAGVTRGALHHHFVDERELFQGVIEKMQQETGETLVPTALAAPTDDVQETFAAAVLATLDAVRDPGRRLRLIEARPLRPVELGRSSTPVSNLQGNTDSSRSTDS